MNLVPVQGDPFAAQPGMTPVEGDPFAEKEEEFDFSAMEMLKNIPGSALQLGKDLTAPIHSPIDTATGLWKVLSGAVQKIIPGAQDNERYADALGQAMVDRYGSVENALKTLQNDPVGILSDVAGVATGGAGLVAKTGLKGAATAAKIAAALEPTAIAGSVAGKLTHSSVPRKLYESAMKPSTALPTATRKQLVETGLAQDVMPTDKGVRKLVQRQEGVEANIANLVEEAQVSGVPITIDRLEKFVPALKRQMGGATIDAAGDLKAIQDTVAQWREHMTKRGQQFMDANDLQKFKTDAYKRIKWNKANLKASAPVEETTKAMARAAREELETMVPSISTANREWGDIEKLLPHLERAAARTGNRDIMGIGAPIKAGAGATLGGPAGAALGVTSGILDMPRPKSYLALKLEKLRKQGKNPIDLASPWRSGRRAGYVQAGRTQEDEEQGTYLYGPRR